MHELAMCEAIARTVAERAEGRPVARVSLRIGHLRQVVPEVLFDTWELVVATGELEGARLDVEYVPATVVCDRCGATTTLEVPILLCGDCDSPQVRVRTGDELLLVALEVGVLDGWVPRPRR